MTILHCADYAAPYAGNFIRSLVALEQSIIEMGDNMAYVFPSEIRHQDWWNAFSADHEVYTTESCRENERTKELILLINKLQPTIVHTHFEGYDIAVARAVRFTRSHARVVWHMHDMMCYHPNPLKHLYQYWCFFRHYCLYGRDVVAIGVSKQILEFTQRFRGTFGGKFLYAEVVENGVDFSRLCQKNDNSRHKPFSFLSFGGRNVQKRVDLLLEAVSELVSKYDIRVIVTNGVDTANVVRNYFNGTIPSWCTLIPQSDDINSIFAQADCFVSTSVHETFSYAICEAVVYGLPVIQSDIEGTLWNAQNPSTFMFHSGDTKDLKKAVCNVLETESVELHKRCSQSRQAVMAKYGIDGWCNKILNIYHKSLV